jgi:hypothetical protein
MHDGYSESCKKVEKLRSHKIKNRGERKRRPKISKRRPEKNRKFKNLTGNMSI